MSKFPIALNLLLLVIQLVVVTNSSNAQFGGGIPAKTHSRVVAICVTNTWRTESTFHSGFMGPVDGAILVGWQLVKGASRARVIFEDGTKAPVVGLIDKNSAKGYAVLAIVGSKPLISGPTVLNESGDLHEVAPLQIKAGASVDCTLSVDDVKRIIASLRNKVVSPLSEPLITSVPSPSAVLARLSAEQLMRLGDREKEPKKRFEYFDAYLWKRTESADSWFKSGLAAIESGHSIAGGTIEGESIRWRVMPEDESKYLNDAVARLRKATQLDPNFGKPYLLLGQIYQNDYKRYEEAVIEYEKASRYCRDDDHWKDRYTAITSLGECYIEIKDYPKAVDALKSAAAISNDPSDYFKYGIECDKLKHHSEAISAYRHGISRLSDKAQAYNDLAAAIREDEGRDEFEQPGDADCWQVTEQIWAYSQAGKLKAGKWYLPWMKMGDLYVHFAKYDEAIEAYSKAIRATGHHNADDNLQQTRVDLIGRIGLCYLFSGRKALAQQQYQQLVDLAKNNSKIGKCAGDEASALKYVLDRPEFR